MPSFIEDCEGVIADAPSRSGNGPGEPGTGFPRTARLLKHADFERVYKQGRRHFSPHMTVFYLVQATDASQEKRARVGFTVGRVLGGAVERNLIKRRLREAVRLRRSKLGHAVDIVINPKKSILTLEFAAVLEEVGKAFDAITKRLAGK
jgi:ribonuclease P protein component